METHHVIALAGGGAIGMAFGAIVQRSNFCIMGAVADYALSGDRQRFREWMLAIASAIAVSQALHLGGLVDLSHAFFRAPRLPVAGIVAGGLMFGFGMVIACGCVSRSLVNAASGDLRALVTVTVIGIFAYATLHGVFAYPRVLLNHYTSIDLTAVGLEDAGLAAVVSATTKLPDGHATLVVSVLVVATLIAAFLRAELLRRPARLIAIVTLGALIAAGWLVTGVLAVDEFDPQPLLSLRFVAPTGDTLSYVMLASGTRADFGITTVAGVLLGAFGSAKLGNEFALRGFEDALELRRYLVGGALMGVGGVLSLGCTVGQGMSGVSTLALGSLLATLCIIGGGILGVRYLEQDSLRGAVRALLGRL